MTVTVQGAATYLVDQGSGPPILFLHGNPDSADLWHNQIAHLSRDYRCLAPDLPGFARSDAPQGFDYSLDSLAAWVEDLLAAANVRGPVHLVVHDLGGPTGLAWATKHPDRVLSLVPINTVFFSDYRWHFFARVWRTPVLGELSMLLMNRFAFRQEIRRGSRKLDRDHIDRTYDQITPQMRRSVLRFYRALTPQKLQAWEEGFTRLLEKVPVMVLWGDHDPYLPSRFAERFGTENVRHFPDCGHWTPEEKALEVSRSLAEFLDGQASGVAASSAAQD
ncbi:alpha/beta fold hydrolase [Hydrocarboniclastica marina]|uniref:Alpha/beta fold hydrolase n=1 Tax=Hydrocarboniclastica marina TaxID=2259620 RepID=A0A4P7XFP7_9ALTE|nr:alpha/beta fold hydrolase [Hydrocarboniclastica marina]MAL97107.1 alpha/beta hydrolase [Alteromonadaceae bacterium]QCF25515.1 alpha/beta fold hydrolase [Hydrocarboniclastica marina]|tara:strand:+ start:263 stop:1093 length:831 start_codon:yes stop_codon:yes gene_type:complete